MNQDLRKQLYTMMIAVAAALGLGRILAAELLLEPSLHRKRDDEPHLGRKWPDDRPTSMPTFSSNDRSRWCTVRSLVEKGTFVIGQRDPALKSETNKYGDVGIVFEDGWQTVDKIMDPKTGEFYSTKPPLLPILMAGEYWILNRAFGWTLLEDTGSIVRIELITFNLLPFVVYLVLLSHLVERLGRTDWARLFVVTTACFGTLMSPFLISINNHTLATCTTLFAVWFALKVWEATEPNGWHFFLAGFFAGLTFCNELPGLAFVVGLGLFLIFRSRIRHMIWYAVGAIVPISLFLQTNWMALGDIQLAYSKFGSEWYKYEGSHWGKEPDPNKPGIDFARLKETPGEYAFHVLLGHHGLFSLTPWVFLAVVGMTSTGCKPSESESRDQKGFALLSLGMMVTIVGFYLLKSDNYGGWTNGPRWLMWLTPLWLLCMIPIADRLSESLRGRGVALVLLALSVMSMNYSDWNPWRHPWIYRWMDAQGLIPY